MAIQPDLRLHEEILLLALHDDKGTISTTSSYALAMGGAILAELLLGERVIIEPHRKHGLVTLKDTRQLGDRILDESLERVRTAKRRAAPATWVSRFCGTKKLRQRVSEALVHKGILRAEEGRVLLVFPRTTYPTSNPRPEWDIVQRLRDAIFSDAGDVDPRTAVLAGIAHATSMLAPVFGRKEIKARKRRIEALGESVVVDGTRDAVRATKSAVEATQAAVMAAVIAATAASAAS